MGGRLEAIWTVLHNIVHYKKKRGMSYLTDIRDWLGGWPMEFSYDDDVKNFVITRLGLEFVRAKTGEANTEFLFKKP